MNKKVRNGVFYFLIGFGLFFAFRLIYSYTSDSKNNYDEESIFDMSSGDSELEMKRNYASSKIRYKEAAPVDHAPSAPASPSAIEQKYEKIARFASKSDQFEDDSKKIRTTIEAFKAVVQFEKSSGNKGNRSLNLSIGVRPDSFDVFCQKVKQIGSIKSVHVSKTDKTNEFKKLNAKRASLEKIRNSLVDLKNKGGRIDEYVALENRILELESELQELGVSLGEFDAENEFCTVYFSLNEGKTVTKISFLHRAKVAFEWSLQFYSLFLTILFLATLVSLILLAIVQKLKLLQLLKSDEANKD